MKNKAHSKRAAKEMRFILCLILFVPAVLLALPTGSRTCEGLIINKHELSFRGDSTFTEFQVESPMAITGYLTVWGYGPVTPHYGSVSYVIYVNGHAVDDITFGVGGWQSAYPGHDIALNLRRGSNRIAFGARRPQVPDIERISLSATRQRIPYNNENYASYIRMAKRGEVPAATFRSCGTYGAPSYQGHIYNEVPVLYSFYKTLFLERDEKISIIGSSDTRHIIDLHYYGRDPADSVEGSNISVRSFGARVDTLLEDDPHAVKTTRFRLIPSEAQQQGLNWKNTSEFSPSRGCQMSRIRVRVPINGWYMLRLRTATNGEIGVATIDVNGEYIYNECPMYAVVMEDSIPDDGDYYSSYATSHNPAVDDPMLWVHGALGDRIVGHNDDADLSNVAPLPVIGIRDPWVVQAYIVPGSGVSVSNWSSYSPIATCDVTVGKYHHSGATVGGGDQPAMTRRHQLSSSTRAMRVQCTAQTNLSGNIEISSAEKIISITAYSVIGQYLGRVKGSNEALTINPANIGINSAGIYILSVATTQGHSNHKIFIKG